MPNIGLTDNTTDRDVLHVTIEDSHGALEEQADNIAAALRGDADAIEGRVIA